MHNSEGVTDVVFTDAGGRTSADVMVFWPGGVTTLALPPEGELRVGRSLECDVAVDHKSLSRQHCVIAVQRGQDRGDVAPRVTIADLGSSNGTVVRGERLQPHRAVSLAFGEMVELGKALLVLRAPRAQVGAVASLSSALTWANEHAVLVSPPMQRLTQMIDQLAPAPISVLLVGETGVGKEVAAELIHRRCGRSGPLLRISCAALSDTSLESALFGYARGALSGATAAKPGLLEAAHGGTLLLDELGELPLATQAKMLRAMESGTVTRLGGVDERPVDVRFISATNRPLEEMVRAGGFRSDLYYRLAGVTLEVAPLRARPEDVEPLIEHFAQQLATTLKRPVVRFDGSARAKLSDYPWPGNVRELRNVVERAVLLCRDGEVTSQHIVFERLQTLASPRTGPAPISDRSPTFDQNPPVDNPSPPPSPAVAAIPNQRADQPNAPLSMELQSLERTRIVNALQRAGGNQTKAAKMLGMSRRTLVSRLDTYQVPRPRKRVDGDVKGGPKR